MDIMHKDTVAKMIEVAKKNLINEEGYKALKESGEISDIFIFRTFDHRIAYVHINLNGHLWHCISIATSKNMGKDLADDIGFVMDIFKFRRDGNGKSYWGEVAGEYLFTFLEVLV